MNIAPVCVLRAFVRTTNPNQALCDSWSRVYDNRCLFFMRIIEETNAKLYRDISLCLKRYWRITDGNWKRREKGKSVVARNQSCSARYLWQTLCIHQNMIGEFSSRTYDAGMPASLWNKSIVIVYNFRYRNLSSNKKIISLNSTYEECIIWST